MAAWVRDGIHYLPVAGGGAAARRGGGSGGEGGLGEPGAGSDSAEAGAEGVLQLYEKWWPLCWPFCGRDKWKLLTVIHTTAPHNSRGSPATIRLPAVYWNCLLKRKPQGELVSKYCKKISKKFGV